MSRTTTALVVPELNGKFELREVVLAEMQPDEVLVEIHATGLCHTDLSFATGVLPCRPNAVLGHEGAGIVLAAGSAVSHVSPGDKVLLSFSHCETCPPCTSGHPAYCHTFNQRNMSGSRPDGSPTLFSPPSPQTQPATEHQNPSQPPAKPPNPNLNPNPTTTSPPPPKEGLFSSFGGQSSLTRHALAHRSCIVPVPPTTDLALCAPLGCGLQTGAGAVLNTLGVRRGSSFAVFGAGAVGMAAIMAAAKIVGAGMVIAMDLQAERLEVAKRLGATHTVRVSGGGEEGNVVGRIREICPPYGVDFALDCTGVTAVIRDMIDCLGTRGRAATVGAPGFGETVSVDVMEHLMFGKEYVGCCEGDSLPSKFIPYLMEAHAKGQFPMHELIRYYDFKDYEKAIEDMRTGKAIKVVLRWT